MSEIFRHGLHFFFVAKDAGAMLRVFLNLLNIALIWTGVVVGCHFSSECFYFLLVAVTLSEV